MAVKFKDYYEVLGVPRTATEDDIRKNTGSSRANIIPT